MSKDFYLIVYEALLDYVDEYQQVDVTEITEALSDVIGDALVCYYDPNASELEGFLKLAEKRIKSKVASYQTKVAAFQALHMRNPK